VVGAIAGDHDLTARLMQHKGVEELSWCTSLPIDELDVIDQDQIGGPVSASRNFCSAVPCGSPGSGR